MKKYPKRIFLVLIALVFLLATIILYPQAYYFKDKIEYKNFRVYCDIKIPDQIYPILDEVDRLISQSECYDPHLKFKIFLRNNVSKYNLFPCQFPSGGFGQTIPLIKNIYLYKAVVTDNACYTHLGHRRTLSNVLAHELTHVLVENKWLLKSKREYFFKDSALGSWKEEGYAEYVAGGSSLSLDDGLKMLNNEVSIEWGPLLEYFKYWFAVRYLVLKKQMTFEEILYAELNLEDVLQEAKGE
ncbi:MAG: hypothetical protein FJZ63_00155 [Chlamydiae bacterium]|nr:hypothetical protein [Chlamydiota bacterium]